MNDQSNRTGLLPLDTYLLLKSKRAIAGMVRPALFFLLAGMTVLSGCTMLDRGLNRSGTAGWSGSNPTGIPYEYRLQQYQLGNIVPNPSFEEGRLTGDNPSRPFALAGWKIIGRHVAWAGRQDESGVGQESADGRYAVKIARQKAGELDEAEGIISDYIPVIPGNYDFTYQIRLKNIRSYKSRMGARLQDAISVKVLFFDSRRHPVDPAAINPVSQTAIDSSDKGFSFANYWTVDDFPWSTVRGRTYNYPYAEGDVPDATRYVRLFFGLRGSGTMWLDDIVFRYSKWNFTTLERFEPYFGRQLTPAESIVPTPKNIQKVGEVVFYDPSRSAPGAPLIVLPDDPAPAERSAAGILQQKIAALMRAADPAAKAEPLPVRIVTGDLPGHAMHSVRLVFSIGGNALSRRIQPDLPLDLIPDRQQGYVIKSVEVDGTRIVFLSGVSPLGSYYAAATAVQLLDNGACVYHDAAVVDYPDFLARSYVFKKWGNSRELDDDLTAMKRMSLFKLNKVYLGYGRGGDSWELVDALYQRGIREAGLWCRANGTLSLAMMVNPYSQLGFEPSVEDLDEHLRHAWTHASPQSFEQLKRVYQFALDAGADTIMLQADDSVPHTGANRQNYSLYTAEDKNRFTNLQNAQAYVINQLNQWLAVSYPGTRLEFCPPWYSNEHVDRSWGKAEQYFKDLVFQIPREVAIIWTGPTIRSLSIDMADLYRFRQLIGRWPMIWDNTLYARGLKAKSYGGYPTYYPGKVKLCNLFEPLDVRRPAGFQNFSDGGRMYTNGAAATEVYRIKYATVADYEWNTGDYDPERSLWKVLCRLYGPTCAEALLRFNNAYYEVYEACLAMETAGKQDGCLKTGERYLREMDNQIARISTALTGSKRLITELQNFRTAQQGWLEKLSRSNESAE